jgi:hypothetical protein
MENINRPLYYTSLPDNKLRTYGGAFSVHDPELCAVRDSLIHDFTRLDSGLFNTAEDIKSEFIHTYPQWLFSGFNFQHTDLYKHACFVQGTTEAFAQFYIRYREQHRLRLRRSEYFYHQMMKALFFEQRFAWLDEDEIRAGDVVLISVPFSDTGDIPMNLNEMLDECERLNVPVMLDMAYLNLATSDSFPHDIDLSRNCIKYVVSSLSKVFPVENMRIGIRLQKEIIPDQLYVINEKNYNYINLLSAFVGTGMMKTFSPDFVFNRYRPKQIALCQQLDLEPSPCFMFGIDHNNRYHDYNRGGTTNRLCFSRIWDGRHKKMNLLD